MNAELNLLITDIDLLGTGGLSSREPRYCARAVPFTEDGVVLLHVEKFDFYTLPGGGVEDGETMEEACVREVKEETGYPCEIMQRLGVVTENSAYSDYHFISFGFTVNITGERGAQNLTLEEEEERTRVVILEPDEALKKLSGQTIVNEDERMRLIMEFIRKRDAAFLAASLLIKMNQ